MLLLLLNQHINLLFNACNIEGVEIKDKTLGIVGCGRIGLVVASCAKAMGIYI